MILFLLFLLIYLIIGFVIITIFSVITNEVPDEASMIAVMFLWPVILLLMMFSGASIGLVNLIELIVRKIRKQ